MILIADAGSTKTAWRLVNNERMLVGDFESGGLNPTVFDEETLTKNIARSSELLNHAAFIKKIFLYGAGTDEPSAKEKLQKVLGEIFDHASLEVYNDLLAAARATAGKEKGIVSIMGTGSNTCYYDGKEIVKSIGGFGYLLMDDASGNWFGKQLLRDYYFNKMPINLRREFKKSYNLNEDSLIRDLYHSPQPNTFLASFAPFMSRYYRSKYVKELLTKGFELLIGYQLSAYEQYKDVPLHFNGSIAYHFQEELLQVIQKHNLIPGKIIKNPLEELVNFHV